eukprot:jgi/Mesvir1/2802/Mv21139-RA.1
MGSLSMAAQGRAETHGIIPRFFEQMFEHRAKCEKFALRVSFVEIHNEEIRDLLDPADSKVVLIRDNYRGAVTIIGLREEEVDSVDAALKVLERGSALRVTAATRMNLTSSRSHAIFTASLEHQVKGEDKWHSAKFHFVDLAGSERAKRTGTEGERFKEGVHINSGLLALGKVIAVLADLARRPGQHIPYRDSKLTRFLQDSLGGNSRTMMIACVSPADVDFEETLNTLKYATRAREITNRPVLNTVMEDAAAQVERLQMLVAQLQQALARCMCGAGGAPAGSGAAGGGPRAAIEAGTGASLPGTAASLPYLGLQLSKKSTNQQLGEGAGGGWDGEMTPEGGRADGEERRRVFGDDHEDEDDNYYDAMGESFDDGVTELKANMTALDEDILAKEKVMASLSRQQQRMQEVLQREEETASRLKSMEREIKAVEAEKKQVLAKLNELESMNRSIKTDLVEVRVAYEEKLRSAQQRLKELNAKQAEAHKWMALKERSDRKLEALQAEITRQKQHRVQLTKDLKKIQDAYRQQSEDQRRDMLALKKQAVKGEARQKALEVENENREKMLQRRAEEREALKKQVKKLQQELLRFTGGREAEVVSVNMEDSLRVLLRAIDDCVEEKEASERLARHAESRSALAKGLSELQERRKQMKAAGEGELALGVVDKQIASMESGLQYSVDIISEAREHLLQLDRPYERLEAKLATVPPDLTQKLLFAAISEIVSCRCSMKILDGQFVALKEEMERLLLAPGMDFAERLDESRAFLMGAEEMLASSEITPARRRSVAGADMAALLTRVDPVSFREDPLGRPPGDASPPGSDLLASVLQPRRSPGAPAPDRRASRLSDSEASAFGAQPESEDAFHQALAWLDMAKQRGQEVERLQGKLDLAEMRVDALEAQLAEKEEALKASMRAGAGGQVVRVTYVLGKGKGEAAAGPSGAAAVQLDELLDQIGASERERERAHGSLREEAEQLYAQHVEATRAILEDLRRQDAELKAETEKLAAALGVREAHAELDNPALSLSARVSQRSAYLDELRAAWASSQDVVHELEAKLAAVQGELEDYVAEGGQGGQGEPPPTLSLGKRIQALRGSLALAEKERNERLNRRSALCSEIRALVAEVGDLDHSQHVDDDLRVLYAELMAGEAGVGQLAPAPPGGSRLRRLSLASLDDLRRLKQALVVQREIHRAEARMLLERLTTLWHYAAVDPAASEDEFVADAQREFGKKGSTVPLLASLKEQVQARLGRIRARYSDGLEELQQLWAERGLGDGEQERKLLALTEEGLDPVEACRLVLEELAEERGRAERIRAALSLIRQRDEMHRAMAEFEKVASDPNRLKQPSAQLLMEEKQRKQWSREYPRLRDRVLRAVVDWEKAEGQELVVDGRHMRRELEAEYEGFAHEFLYLRLARPVTPPVGAEPGTAEPYSSGANASNNNNNIPAGGDAGADASSRRGDAPGGPPEPGPGPGAEGGSSHKPWVPPLGGGSGRSTPDPGRARRDSAEGPAGGAGASSRPRSGSSTRTVTITNGSTKAAPASTAGPSASMKRGGSAAPANTVAASTSATSASVAAAPGTAPVKRPSFTSRPGSAPAAPTNDKKHKPFS